LPSQPFFLEKKGKAHQNKKNPEETPQLTLSLQWHLLKWRQERKDQKEGFFNTSRTKPSSLIILARPPPPLFCQPLKEHSLGINHIDPRKEER
jgi:hypothetical protein